MKPIHLAAPSPADLLRRVAGEAVMEEIEAERKAEIARLKAERRAWRAAQPSPTPLDEALSAATHRGDVGQARELLEKGAQIGARMGDMRVCALDLAVDGGRDAIVELMLSRPEWLAAAREAERQAALFAQISLGLRDAGCPPSVWLDGMGMTALGVAVQRGRAQCVRLLLDAGASDPIALNCHADRPLDTAAHLGHAECVRALWSATPDPDGVRHSYHNGLQQSGRHASRSLAWRVTEGPAFSRKAPAMVALIELGGDLSAPGHDGETLFEYCAANGLHECLSAMVRHGAGLPGADRHPTPLHAFAASLPTDPKRLDTVRAAWRTLLETSHPDLLESAGREAFETLSRNPSPDFEEFLPTLAADLEARVLALSLSADAGSREPMPSRGSLRV
jgi:hypothetical protein